MLSKIKIILTSKLFYFGLFLIFFIPYIYSKLPIRIDITQQNSLENSIWITYSDVNRETEYILFTPPKSKYIKNEKIQYLKKIGCKEGMYLEVLNDSYFCNNELIGKALKYDGNNKPLTQFIYNGYIPKDNYFVIGTHELSYDSKYFGFISKDKVLRTATPLKLEIN